MVDRRPISEPIGWALLVFTAPMVWFRLARQTDRLMFEHATTRLAKPRRRGPWLAIGSAVLMYWFPPGSLFGRVLRMQRLRGSRWSDYVIVVGVLAIYIGAYWVFYASEVGSSAQNFGFVALFAVPALAVGAGQALADRHVESLGELEVGRSTPVNTRLKFNSPPAWPDPPDGWSPPSGWTPDASWPAAPDGWHFWVATS